jgi:hypothetical protein
MSYAILMVVMTPREKWTDDRLDDLNQKVDQGFARMDARFEHLETRFDALNRTLIGGFVVLVAALIGSTATLAGIALF